MIIGLTGKMAAGKGVVAEYLKNKGYSYHSLSDVLRDELKVRNIEETIPNLVKLGNELRAKNGAGVIGKRLLKKIQDNSETNAIADSIRNPAEIASLKESDHKFILIAVDAPLELRYQRTASRGRAGDNMTLEKFKEEDFKQLKNSDPNAQQILECFKQADYTVVNEGTLAELQQKIDGILSDVED